jgi:two-component system copper resistance phosphate regulon response regulator CusR
MEAQKLLIVEDEPKVVSFIKKGLEEHGFAVSVAYDGLAAKRMVRSESHDLIIIDVNIPIVNGYQLCSHIREFNKHVPILMLTAMGSMEDKLQGFAAGADDYLLKPFEFLELLARIKVLMKRAQFYPSQEIELTINDLVLNADTKMVRREDKKIDLTAKEFALLEYFMRNKGRVISRLELAEKIWDINFDTGTNVIDVYINFLRKKIDRDFDKKLIHTYIGMGYALKEDTEE